METTENQASPVTESRRVQRFACSGDAQVIDYEAGIVLMCEVRDMGTGGCMVVTRKARKLPEAGTLVHLYLTIHSQNYEVPAFVRNAIGGQRLGLEFNFPSETERAAFNQLFYEIQH